MADLAALAAAISSYRPGDLAAVSRVQEVLMLNASARMGDLSECESFMMCVFKSLAEAGDNGKDLLDQLLLEVLPQLAPLADLSPGCTQSLTSICGLAAAACTPRDTITAFLEVMDQMLSAASLSQNSLQFLCNLLSLVPQQLAKLSRRKAAFTTECLLPAAALAKEHGEMLQGWMITRLKLAASHSSSATDSSAAAVSRAADPSVSDVLQRMDTLLAANWQMYADFVSGILHKVLPREPDAAAAASCKQAVGNLILHLLLHLTVSWPPPVLLEIALQTLSSPVAAGQLPSAASVQAPTPIASPGNAARPRTAAAAAQESSVQSGGDTTSTAGKQESDAAGVVAGLLKLLQDCQCATWDDFAGKAGDEAAGAALAVLYSSWFEGDSNSAHGMLQLPTSSIATIQLACSWCMALSETSQGNPLVTSKIIALLQITLARCASQQQPPSTDSAGDSTGVSAAQNAAHLTSIIAGRADGMASAAAAAASLLPQLEPCINLLASTIASGVAAALRAQATLALQQLLRAPGKAVCYCCLEELLAGSSSDSSGRRVHPEVAALLMQEVRQQLASSRGSGPFSNAAAAQLVLPWFQQHSKVGWRDADQLADNANAICAALAVVRLALLRQHQDVIYPQAGPTTEGVAAAGATAGANVPDLTAAGSTMTEKCISPNAQQRVGLLQGLLLEPLQQLSAAVTDALQTLQAVNRAEQGGFPQLGASSSCCQQQRVCIPGDAQGAGQAVDAWLAVSRVQDVLDRVLELL